MLFTSWLFPAGRVRKNIDLTCRWNCTLKLIALCALNCNFIPLNFTRTENNKKCHFCLLLVSHSRRIIKAHDEDNSNWWIISLLPCSAAAASILSLWANHSRVSEGSRNITFNFYRKFLATLVFLWKFSHSLLLLLPLLLAVPYCRFFSCCYCLLLDRWMEGERNVKEEMKWMAKEDKNEMDGWMMEKSSSSFSCVSFPHTDIGRKDENCHCLWKRRKKVRKKKKVFI